MIKLIFTTLILMTTLLCAAQNGSKSPGTFTCGSSTVTDADGNVYSTVQIGDQCWMGENMRVGIMLNGSENQTNNGITEKHCYANNPSNCLTYGGLYQWNELMQYAGQGPLQGICPTGWHIPTSGEWQWLATILVTPGGKMKSTGTIEAGTGLWHAPNAGATNSSGFNALPGGWKNEAGNFVNLGYYAYFFSSIKWYDCCAYFYQLSYLDESFGPSWTYLSNSLSVRCLKNPEVLPTVSTSSISGITANTAVGGGNVTNDGGGEVSARGVVWNATQNPTVLNHAGITTNGTGVGPFTSNLTGLASGTTYYVKAYATNSMGTAYGSQVEFTAPMASVLSVADLTINAGTDTCFGATQTLTVSNFTVNGGSLTLVAGGNIKLQPATKVQNGGYLHAYITTSSTYCPQPAASMPLNGENSTMEVQSVVLQDASVSFTIFPNPTTGKFSVELHDFDNMKGVQVEICSIMGQRVLQTELPGQPRFEFDLTGWPKGVYLIRVIAGEKMSVGKLIRQ
jgi:uncharacterized protein (TIGR02145 family)